VSYRNETALAERVERLETENEELRARLQRPRLFNVYVAGALFAGAVVLVAAAAAVVTVASWLVR
jgi:hypothetical protein